MSEPIGEPGKAISNLEKALVPHNFLLMAIFTLLVDSSLLKLHGLGLLDYAVNSDRIKPSFALEVFLLFVGYSFLMAILLPLISHFSNEFYLELIWRPWRSFGFWLEKTFRFESRTLDEKPSSEYVSYIELKIAAHTQKDSYLLDLYWREEKNRNTARTASLNFQLYSVGALLVMGVNYYMSGNSSLLNRIAIYLGSEYWITAALAWMGFCAFGLQFFLKEERWVYCPTLARELEEERKKKSGLVPHLYRGQ